MTYYFHKYPIANKHCHIPNDTYQIKEEKKKRQYESQPVIKPRNIFIIDDK